MQIAHPFSIKMPVSYCHIGKYSWYVLRSIQNTYVHCVGRTQNLLMLNLAVHKITTRL